LLEWIGKHRQAATYGGVALVAAVGLLVWNLTSRGRTEVEARSALTSARVAFESRNLGLASSELSRVRENYSGTLAAEEATLLLAQVRLLQGQADQGLQMLQEFAPGASAEYRSKAFGLLGAALENAGRSSEAAQAYERAGNDEELPALQAQYLSEGGRAWAAAGDTARAVSLYRRIVSELGTTNAATEASVRIGELTRGAATP
jgi:tetratricopeptide (TPR) repeat protein